MLFYLSHYHLIWSPLNVFQYISFRSGGSFLTALFIMLVSEIVSLPDKEVGNHTIHREYGPKTHLAKAGTPTMGGLSSGRLGHCHCALGSLG